MITYATLTQLRERLGIPAADTSDDGRLLAALRQATAQIERYTARRFAPTVQTRRYDYLTPYRLNLDIDLLQLIALVNGDGSSIDVDDAILLPTGDGPKHAIALDVMGGVTFNFESMREQAIQVTGVWGWHDAWSEAWRNSADTVQNAPLSDSAASITVSDADGADAAGLSPRFQVGQLLKIEDEYLHVIAVNPTTNAVSVIRGVRGTTATSHAQGTTIHVYAPPQDVQALCLRWATWLYQQVDAAIGAGADWLYPPDLPPDVRTLAAPFRRVRVA